MKFIFWAKSAGHVIGLNKIKPQTKFPDGSLNEMTGMARFDNHIFITEEKRVADHIRESCKSEFASGNMKELTGEKELQEFRDDEAKKLNLQARKSKKRDPEDIGAEDQVVDVNEQAEEFTPV